MKRILTFLVLVVIISSTVVWLAGCSSNSGSSGTLASLLTSSTSATSTTTGASATGASFKVKGAAQLVSLSNTVAASGKTTAKNSGIVSAVKSLLGSSEPFEYTIVNQGLSDKEVLNRLKGKAATGAVLSAAGSGNSSSGTNLLSVDPYGNTQLAINSDYLIKVMYSVTDPKGEFVYVALDTGIANPDGNDYTPFIAKNNCALYRVSIADDTNVCVYPGVYVQKMDDVYLRRVNGNVKPIQFDSDGNVYFPGTAFVTNCSTGTCTMIAADWNPRIYRVSAVDGSVLALTQDNQNISYFMTLATGEIAYQSIDANGNTALYLWQKGIDPTINPNGKTINLTGSTVGVDYFTADTYNTIMWGGWTESGIRFARPSSSGLVEKATLDTSIFRPQSGMGFSVSNAFPALRVIVGEEGLYGVFKEFTEEESPKGSGQYKYYDVLKVYQVLPNNMVPKVEVKIVEKDPMGAYLGTSDTWQQWMGNTPFQVSQGYIYYKEPTEKVGYGVHDVIKMVSLTDRRTIPLLANNMYEIYTWRLRGKMLYFAALDLDQTKVISGQIDTSIVKTNPLADPLSTYMKVNVIASAIGANSRVQDIESLSALPTIAITDPPTVQKVYADPENIYSTSIEFNKLMDEKSVEDHLTFKDHNTGAEIATMKVWINNYVHLIPDLDTNVSGLVPAPADDALLDLTHTTPLSYSTQYDFGVNAGALDSGTPAQSMAAGNVTSLLTRPEAGWFTGLENGTNKYVKFYGKNKATSSSQELYELNGDSFDGASNTWTSTATGTPGIGNTNFRVQFRAKNGSYGAMAINLYDLTYTDSIADVSLRSNPEIYTSFDYNCYGTTYQTSSWAYPQNYISELWNGEWMWYRVDVYGAQMTISYSKDNITYTPITFSYQYLTDCSSYWTTVYRDYLPLTARSASDDYRLILRVSQPVAIDDIGVYALTSTGSLASTTPLWSDDFSALTAGTVPGGYLSIDTSATPPVTNASSYSSMIYPSYLY